MLVKLGSSVKHVDYNNLKGQNYTTENRSTMSEEEKENVEKIFFLLDKLCVGDAFNPEISTITDGLPRSYLVKQCRDFTHFRKI